MYSEKKGENMRSKHLITLSIIFVVGAALLFLIIKGLKSIKVDDFKPAAVIFVIDSSASNQKSLPAQKKFVKQLCSTLDPEDHVKIIKVSEDAYLIYEGTPQNGSGITKSMNAFTQFAPEERGTAYGDAMKKALQHSITMKQNGYTPAVIVIGDLENEGATAKQINWNTLPANVENTKKHAPDLSMAFLYAHPEKLDFVKGKLNPVLGEDHLTLATEQTIDKVSTKIMHAIGR